MLYSKSLPIIVAYFYFKKSNILHVLVLSLSPFYVTIQPLLDKLYEVPVTLPFFNSGFRFLIPIKHNYGRHGISTSTAVGIDIN